MKLNNINDSTKLSVRVPKALYESIQKELKRKKLNEVSTFYLVDDKGEKLDSIEADSIEDAKAKFQEEYEGIMSSCTVVPKESLSEEYSGEMPVSFDISLAIKRVEDAISDLEKVKQTLLKIENKNN